MAIGWCRDLRAESRDADRGGVNPGEALTDLLRLCAPCLILIDEWVAYARNLYGVSGLPAGSFDAQFTFAQALTDAARSVPQALVVATIPASDIEVGGEGGRGRRSSGSRTSLAAWRRPGGLRRLKRASRLFADGCSKTFRRRRLDSATQWLRRSATCIAARRANSRSNAEKRSMRAVCARPIRFIQSFSTASSATGQSSSGSNAPAACCG